MQAAEGQARRAPRAYLNYAGIWFAVSLTPLRRRERGAARRFAAALRGVRFAPTPFRLSVSLAIAALATALRFSSGKRPSASTRAL